VHATHTFDPSGKLKRMRRNADVEVAPSTQIELTPH
jgi:hypothetical protein